MRGTNGVERFQTAAYVAAQSMTKDSSRTSLHGVRLILAPLKKQTVLKKVLEYAGDQATSPDNALHVHWESDSSSVPDANGKATDMTHNGLVLCQSTSNRHLTPPLGIDGHRKLLPSAQV